MIFRTGQSGQVGHRAQIMSKNLVGSVNLIHRMAAEINGDRNTKHVHKTNRKIIKDDVIVGAVPYHQDDDNKDKSSVKLKGDDKGWNSDDIDNELAEENGFEDLVEMDVKEEEPEPGVRHEGTKYYFDEPDKEDEDSKYIFDKDDALLTNDKDKAPLNNDNNDNDDDLSVLSLKENRAKSAPTESNKESDDTEETMHGNGLRTGFERKNKSFGSTIDNVRLENKADNNDDQNLIFVNQNHEHEPGRSERRMKKVILLTYMRSGSSYVGSLLEV
ncbi:hypothetical protein ElyMa_000323600 [Elysia marginata]|uniref:Sulfotransferase domain-containing protein n=1 Tax=Elysia marginata TaxID=1093978 RepID=A0AAV4FBD7_9GAST|nr:hypothetical protein ElyMa_000323600 [Elysia marginata]